MSELLRYIPPEVIAAIAGVGGTLLAVWLRNRVRRVAQRELLDTLQKRAAKYTSERYAVAERNKERLAAELQATLRDGPTSDRVRKLVEGRGTGEDE